MVRVQKYFWMNLNGIRKGEEIMNNSWFNAEEIKYKIDTAIQLSMYYSDKEVWDALLEAQTRLYEQFGIDD
jgi:hypothetical protein